MRVTRYNAKGPKSQWLAILVLALLPLAALLQGFWVVRNKDSFRPFLLKFQVETIDCPYCGGVGTTRNPGAIDEVVLCPVCFGTGGHQVRRLNSRTDVLCPACGGLGRVIDASSGGGRACLRCGGRGLITTETPDEDLAPGEETPASDGASGL